MGKPSHSSNSTASTWISFRDDLPDDFSSFILQSYMETTLDGVLIVDADWQMVSFNQQFADMWSIAEEILLAKDDRKSVASVLEQLTEPEHFLRKIEYLMQHPSEKSQDILKLKDGRVLYRHSAPIRNGQGEHFGRIWFFRDITEVKKAGQVLKKNNRILEKVVNQKTAELQEMNAGLRSLLTALDKEKSALENRFSANFNKLILPMLADLKETATSVRQTSLIETIEATIQDLSSDINLSLISREQQLTPAEIKIANLLKLGKSTKEIAITLDCATRTVDGHRSSIRKKLQLSREQNLQAVLQALSQPN